MSKRRSVMYGVVLAILFLWCIPASGQKSDPKSVRSAQITSSAPEKAASIIGKTGRISAIKGNQVTIEAVNDVRRRATIQVRNASMFRVGDQVTITGNVLNTLGAPAGLPSRSPSAMVDRSAQIINLQKSEADIIGKNGIITSISGNRITVQNSRDIQQHVTIAVDDASPFRLGDRVSITAGRLIASRIPKGSHVTSDGDDGGDDDWSDDDWGSDDDTGDDDDDDSDDNSGGDKSGSGNVSGQAYSTGDSIQFKTPDSGTNLVAHEIAHVKQAPDPPPDQRGIKSTRIRSASSSDFNARLSNSARITAIRGNQITMQHLTYASKTATVTVNNSSLFKVGQQVNINGDLLTPQATGGKGATTATGPRSPGPDPGPHPAPIKSARITSAPNNLNLVVGNQARVIAVKGNQVTLQNLNDASKRSTVQVNDTSVFKVGQTVSIQGSTMTLQAAGKTSSQGSATATSTPGKRGPGPDPGPVGPAVKQVR